MYVGVLPGRASVRIHSTTCCRHAARRRFTRSDRHDGQGDRRVSQNGRPCNYRRGSALYTSDERNARRD